MSIAGKINRKALTFLLAAGLFLILGAGNTIYGYSKVSQYSELLEQVNAEPAKKIRDSETIPFIDSYSTPAMQGEYKDKLSSSISYYKVVFIGGKVFLAFSLLLFILTGLTARSSPSS